MQASRIANRAAQTISPSGASRLVTEAARRASAAPAKRRRSLRNYTDIIAVAVASIAAANGLKNKRDHNERISIMEAEMHRAEGQRDEGARRLSEMKEIILQVAPQAVAEMENVQRGNKEERLTARTRILQAHLRTTFDEFPSNWDEELRKHPHRQVEDKPKLI